MENISYFLKVYFVATFQLYETTCSSFPNTKHFPNKDCLRLLRSLCSGPLCSRATTSGFSFLWFYQQQILANSSTLAQEFVKQRRKQVPSTQRRAPKQHQLCLYIISSSSPLSSQVVVQSILKTKWWPSCVTFRMGKSKTNAQILKTAIKLLAQMRKWVAKPNQSNSIFRRKQPYNGQRQ